MQPNLLQARHELSDTVLCSMLLKYGTNHAVVDKRSEQSRMWSVSNWM